MRPYTHTLLYAFAGARKSTMAETYPGPKIVASFDPLGKETPYLGHWEGKEFVRYPVLEDIPKSHKIVEGRGGITKVVYFHENNINKPDAFKRFQQWIISIPEEFHNPWETVVFDSMTYANAYIEFEHGGTSEDIGDQARDAKFALQRLLMIHTVSWDVNLVVVAHVDYEKTRVLPRAQGGGVVKKGQMEDADAVSRYKPRFPGKLAGDIMSAFPETYHNYIENDKGMVLTRSKDLYSAQTQINAPSPCEANYEALWRNYK